MAGAIVFAGADPPAGKVKLAVVSELLADGVLLLMKSFTVFLRKQVEEC